jgi:hypothetical protein
MAPEVRGVLKPDAYMPFRGASSPLMYIVIATVNALAAPLPMTWVRRFVYPLLRRSSSTLGWTRVIVDGYLVALIALETAALFLARPDGSVLAPIIAIYGLWDLLVATLRDLLINPSLHRDQDGPFLLVQDPIRWFALFLAAPAQAILCFAVLYVHFADAIGGSFLTHPGNALYFSFRTFLTLDSSSIIPVSSAVGKVLVAVELAFFAMILTVKLPLAIALTRAKGGGGAADNAQQ